MGLDALLEAATCATPGRRIELRDEIAAYGAPAIDGVRPWLQNDTLAAFAVRVIERAGLDGEGVLAAQVLRWARTRVPAAVTGDVEWALQQLRAARRPVPAPPAAPSPSASPRLERPLYPTVAAHRAR
ncbi:MAG: hypothetical protein WCH74_03500 [Chloroflexota bacterium]